MSESEPTTDEDAAKMIRYVRHSGDKELTANQKRNLRYVESYLSRTDN